MTKIYLYRLGYSDGLTAYAAVLARNPISLIISAYILIGLVFVLGLVGFHTFLVCTGQTTNEQLKHQYPHGSPNSTGCYKNFIQLICTVPATHLDVRQTYVPTRAAYRNSTQDVDVKYIDQQQLQKMAERAYDTSATSIMRPDQYNNNLNSQTRRNSTSVSHIKHQSIELQANSGRHTRNQSMMPMSDMHTIDEHGNTVPIIQHYQGTTPRANGSPAHQLTHSINAAGMTVEPKSEQRIGPSGNHTRTPSLSIVVSDVVPSSELADRSAIQSPLYERAPSISQVNLYTPINGSINHSFDHNNTQSAVEDNAIRDRSVFQSPLLHSRNNSVSILAQYNDQNGSPNHHRRTSSAYQQISQSSPNRRASISNTSALLTPRSAEYTRRQSLTPANEARAAFMSPEASMPINSSRRASTSSQINQLPAIPDQPTEFNL